VRDGVSVYEILPSNCMHKAFYLRKKYAREMIPYCEEYAQVVIFHKVRGKKAVEQVITRYANLGASQVRCDRDHIVGITDIVAGEEEEEEAY